MYLKRHRNSSEHTLILDSGDFNGGYGDREQLKAEYIAKAFSKMKIDAINPGERDFLHGVNFLKDMQKENRLPFVCSNIFQSDSTNLVFEPYIIKKLNGFEHGDVKIPSIKVGIFGIIMKRSQLTYSKNEEDLYVGDPITAAAETVQKIKGKCDLIICLAHLRYMELNQLAESVPDIDIIISGHDPIVRQKVQQIGNSLLIAGGSKGQYIGDLRLILNHDYDIIDYDGNVVTLDDKIQDEPEMLEFVNKYKIEEIKVLKKQTRSQVQKMEMYVGAEKCKECHEKQYKQWTNSKHANAFDILEKQNETKNFQCTQCHTTGFSKYNGFYTIDTTPEMINVQCESCHGIGKLHVQSVQRYKEKNLPIPTILTPITRETCIPCHTISRDPKFDFKEDLKLVKH